MLLDTLCNAFGGIVFIAMLLTIVPTSAPPEENSTQKTAAILLDRELARADERIAALKAELERLGTRGGSDASNSGGATRLQHLEDELKALTAAERELRGAIDKTVSDILNKDAIDEAKLNADLSRIREQIAAAASALGALKEDLARLEQRAEELKEKLAMAKKPKTERFRLPKEHRTNKSYIYVLVRHGRVYPFEFVEDGTRRINTRTLTWRSSATGATPQFDVSLGWQTASGSDDDWRNYLQSVPSEKYYLAFCVWPDSFEQFRQAKNTATALNRELTWEPTNDEIHFVSSGGTSPSQPL
jgi:hypothetical protein